MKGMWKQSGLAAMACADAGQLSQAGRSRRRGRLVVYAFAVAFAALTAYIALCSPAAPAGAAGDGASWFDGVYASTAPYRSQVSTFFSSIFPTNSSAPSPEPSRPDGGGAASGSSEVNRDVDSKQVGSGAGSGSSGTAGSDKQLGSGGSAPSSNAAGAGAPSAGNPAGSGTAAATSDSPMDNPATSGGAPVSGADRNKGSSQAEAGGSAGERTVAKADEESDGSNKQSGSGAPTNNGAAGNVTAVKADTKDSVDVSGGSSARDGSTVKADPEIGPDNQAVTPSAAPSSGSAAGNSTTAKADGKDSVGAASSVSAGIDTVAKADLNNESNASSGSENGDATHQSAPSASPVKSNAEDGGIQSDKASEYVASTSNQTAVATEKGAGSSTKNQTLVASPTATKQNQTSGASSVESGSAVNNKEATPQVSAGSFKDHSSQTIAAKAGNHSEVLVKGNVTSTKQAGGASGNKKVDWITEMAGCDLFHGNWVQDDSYPLYPGGSCPHIDEPFDCHLNGRPDRAYEKLRWQPSGCSIPRLNPTDMLERLRGKRLVFVGDSLNRNMWESLVCILRNSVKDKRKVFEASGRREFKTEGSYSFLFTDYNCSVEFFRSPFLVQEWETRVSNGNKKETLRLDIVEQSSPKYKDAEFIIFNTGHWWTHEKTALGKDYYQEGSHIYSELNVVDAFHKALITWSRWIDANVNPKKTTVMFRGYSASHFSGGQWNSGGSCDKETEPIRNEQYLSTYPPKMSILEDVIHKMRTPVVYLNITRLTDYRKDAHPSIYRKQHLSEEERRSPERYQDCSHWCLPGVPDSWNELVYAQLLISQHQMLQH
ncbi:protein trichome birefringence-like 1 [Hordeum vulgare subsp. vulgare]|uniref:Trichome birefringence-like N-terminal domain-containing protein n=1 Tax=Hordeum vulgare subsp. vulgare TaxID=112509 RepID=A0A8I7BDP6_HORVV|nr:protein trichome birefringence-like 1 [Hordeum vulgare subsp. vulgare]